MARPTPKKTSLNTQHPGEPPQEKQAAEPAAEQPASTEAGQGDAGEKQPAKPKKYPPKMSIYQDPEDTDRIRGAIIHTMAQEGYRTLSQFVNQAVMAEVHRLEAQYNGGEPFPPVSAKGFPKGRPMGE